MGLQTEADNIGRENWGMRFSDVIRKVNIEQILLTGTSLQYDQVTEVIERFATEAEEAEQNITTGGINISDSKRLRLGWLEACVAAGSRGITRIIELTAQQVDYQGELHESTDTIKLSPTLLQEEGGLFIATIFHPLPKISIRGVDGREWNGAVFRKTITPVKLDKGIALINPVGLAYIKQ